jgi:Uncharacterized conserved protein
VSKVRIFRVLHEKYSDEPFSGKGGLYASSRWASMGQLVSYAAGNLALAALEKIAGAGQLSRLGEMVYVPAEVSEEAIQVIGEPDLPEGWDRRPPGRVSQRIGDQWLRNEKSVALRVPSVILPEGSTYVLNPSHPSFDDALTPGTPASLNLESGS